MLFRSATLQCLVPNVIMWRQQFLLRTSFNVPQLLILSRRTSSIICQPLSQLSHENFSVKPNGKKSLAWRQLHDQMSTSYGVHSFNGYFELVLRNTSLSCKMNRVMESAFDYIRNTSFEVYCRRTILDVLLEIAEPLYLEKI